MRAHLVFEDVLGEQRAAGGANLTAGADAEVGGGAALGRAALDGVHAVLLALALAARPLLPEHRQRMRRVDHQRRLRAEISVSHSCITLLPVPWPPLQRPSTGSQRSRPLQVVDNHLLAGSILDPCSETFTVEKSSSHPLRKQQMATSTSTETSPGIPSREVGRDKVASHV